MSYPSVKLSSGYMMPVLGLGTWQCPPEEAYRVAKAAIKIGYRHIDTAQAYFNEEGVGQAITECIQEGIIKREDIFITTKLWPSIVDPSGVEKACRASLKNLNVDYLDLLLIHNPFLWRFDDEAQNKRMEEEIEYNYKTFTDAPLTMHRYDAKREAAIWAAMEDLVDKGLVHSIGISNFSAKKTAELLKTARIIPATNQIEFNPPNQQTTVANYCLSKGIAITAYTQFGRPVDSDPSLAIPLKDPTIAAIGKKYNKTNAQVIIRWLIQRKIFTIPKSTHEERMRENFDVFDFELSDEDMKAINDLNRNDRTFKGEFFARCGMSRNEVWDNEDCENQ